MPSWLSASWSTVGVTAASTLAVYVAVVVYTRLGGLRSFAKMSGFDFAATVAIGSMLATASLSTSTPIVVGLVGVGTLYVAQLTVAVLRRFDVVHGAVDNAPLLVMAGGEVLHDNLRRGRMTEDELRAKLREANVLRFDQVRAVVLESTGDVAVLHGDADGPALDPQLLDGVRDVERLRER